VNQAADTTPATAGTYGIGLADQGSLYLSMGAGTATGAYIQSWQNKPLLLNSQGNNVGIGTYIPSSTLSINGSMGMALSTITANTTLDATKNIVFANNSGDISITLPSPATATGRAYYIKKISSNTNTVTILPSSSETIEGGSALVLFVRFDSVRLVSDGSNWYILEDAIKLHAASLGRAVAVQSVPNNANTKILLDTTDLDVGGLADVTTNRRINIRRTGAYLVTASTYFVPGANKRIDANIFVNGTNVRMGNSGSSDNTDGTSTQSSIINLNAGDYIELWVYHMASGALNTSTSTHQQPRLSVFEIR
jgi:hypothetical protein